MTTKVPRAPRDTACVADTQAPARVRHGALDALLGFRLRLAQIVVFRDLHRALDAAGVTPAGFGVLELAHANPGLTQAQIAAAIRLDDSSLVPLIDRLAERGLVRRETPRNDRRRNLVVLTDAGKRVRRSALAAIRAHERRVFGPLDPTSRAALGATLAALAGAKPGVAVTRRARGSR